MPLPFILGAIGVAAATAVAIAVSDDSSSSSSSNNNSDNEESERRKAERKLKEKRRLEKRQALSASYEERLESDGAKLKSLLTNVVDVQSRRKPMVAIDKVPKINLNPDDSLKSVLNSNIITYKLTLKEFHSNVLLFESLYDVNVRPKNEVLQVANSIDNLERQISKIDKLIKKLS